MKRIKYFWILSIIFAVLVQFSCRDNNREQETDHAEMEEARTFEEIQDERTNSVTVTVKGTPQLSTFANRLDDAEVNDSIEGAEGDLTIFAPNNNAYSRLYQENDNQVLRDIEHSEEIQFLVAKGEFTSDDLRQGIQENNGTFTIPTLEGSHLMVSLMNDSILVRGHAGNGAKILQADLDASNGVVHVISSVILPGEVQKNVELEGNQ